MAVKAFLENGKLFDAKVLSITSKDILGFFTAGTNNLTSISLASGYVVKSAAPHMLINAFKNLAGCAIAAKYDFPQLDAIKNAAAAGPAAGAAAGGAKAAAAAVVEEEPEEDVDMGDLFGGGEDDY
jgi:large subunit ribosomal protein LP0